MTPEQRQTIEAALRRGLQITAKEPCGPSNDLFDAALAALSEMQQPGRPLYPPGSCTSCGMASAKFLGHRSGCPQDNQMQQPSQPCGCRSMETMAVEREFSLLDRFVAVKTLMHAYDYLRDRSEIPCMVNRSNALSLITDGIINAIDGRTTGREFRTARHSYLAKHDPQHHPVVAEHDRRCHDCGAINPEPFTYCHQHRPSPCHCADLERQVRELVEGVRRMRDLICGTAAIILLPGSETLDDACVSASVVTHAKKACDIAAELLARFRAGDEAGERISGDKGRLSS